MSNVRKSSDGCAFEVPVERPTTPGSSPPKCFTKPKTKSLSPRDIEEKQQQAEARRKVNQCLISGESMMVQLCRI